MEDELRSKYDEKLEKFNIRLVAFYVIKDGFGDTVLKVHGHLNDLMIHRELDDIIEDFEENGTKKVGFEGPNCFLVKDAGKVVAWMNPMNGAIITPEKKTQPGIGNGYERFSVPLVDPRTEEDR